MNRNLAFFTTALVFTSAAIWFVAQYFGPPTFLLLILSSLGLATWLIYLWIRKTNKKSFIRNYLLTIVLKLLVGGIFVFVLLVLDRSGAQANALLFLIAYILFTGLEVAFLFERLNRKP